MRKRRSAYKWLVRSVRWVARISGTLMAGLIIFVGGGDYISGSGLPNPFTEPLGVTMETVGLLICLAGLIISWRWARLGGVLILMGMLTFHIIEWKVWLNWVFLVLELVGFGHLCTWVLSRWLNNFTKQAAEELITKY